MTRYRHIIKISEGQERTLREASGEGFEYLDLNNGYSPYNGKTEVSVSGNVDGETEAKPTTGDKVARMLTPQSYNRYRTCACGQVTNMREGVDTNNDGIDDFYNDKQLDILSNGDESDNQVIIPKGVDDKCDLLLSAMSRLMPKQKAIVLNKMIESCDLSALPYAWKKELIKKIAYSQGNEGNVVSNDTSD